MGMVATSAFGGTLIKLSGTIDERFNRAELVDAGRGLVVLDLDEVTRITSYGVREWMRALGDLDAHYIGLVRCRPAIVAQLNMVAGFAGRGEVLSVYAPYVCPKCGKNFEVLLDILKV